MSSSATRSGRVAVGGRGDLAVALAQLGLDVGEAEALVDLGLGRVAGDLAGSVSVIPCSETESPILTARSRSSMLCSAEPVKC